MFDTLVDTLKELLPELGFSVAVDSKGVSSAGRPTKETEEEMDAGTGMPIGERRVITAKERTGPYGRRW